MKDDNIGEHLRDAARWRAMLEMLSGTAVSNGSQRWWTVITPLAPDDVYRNHMTEFTAAIDASIIQNVKQSHKNN